MASAPLNPAEGSGGQFFSLQPVEVTEDSESPGRISIDADLDSDTLSGPRAERSSGNDPQWGPPPFIRYPLLSRPLVIRLSSWSLGLLLASSFFWLPVLALALLIPIASFFALPLLLITSAFVFFSIPSLAYLLLAQKGAPSRASSPFLPRRDIRHLLRLNLAALRWTIRASSLLSSVLPEIIKTKLLYALGRSWTGRAKTNIRFSNYRTSARLDVYLPKPSTASSGLYLQSSTQAPDAEQLVNSPSPLSPTAAEAPLSAPQSPNTTQPTNAVPPHSQLAPIIIFIPSPSYFLLLRSRKWMFASLGRNLARMGYCVIIPDLVAFGNEEEIGLGKGLRDHLQANENGSVKGVGSSESSSDGKDQGRSRIRESVEELRRVMRWAWDNGAIYGGDRDRIYLCGHGLGAHLALLHIVQRAVVQSRDNIFKSSLASSTGGAAPHVTISNGMRRVQEYGRDVWAPNVEGMILLSPICDVEKQVLMESELGISHLSVVRRSLGPTQLQCILHSPAHVLHASRNAVEIEALPKRILFIHGGFDRVVNWSQSENMKELLRGVGIEDVKTRVYTTGHTGVVTAMMSHERGTILAEHIVQEVRAAAPI